MCQALVFLYENVPNMFAGDLFDILTTHLAHEKCIGLIEYVECVCVRWVGV